MLKKHKVIFLIILIIFIIFSTFIIFKFKKNYDTYMELLPSAQKLGLNYPDNNLIVLSSTIDKMQEDIEKAQKEADEKALEEAKIKEQEEAEEAKIKEQEEAEREAKEEELKRQEEKESLEEKASSKFYSLLGVDMDPLDYPESDPGIEFSGGVGFPAVGWEIGKPKNDYSCKSNSEGEVQYDRALEECIYPTVPLPDEPYFDEDMQQELFEAINEKRLENDVEPLMYFDKYQNCANWETRGHIESGGGIIPWTCGDVSEVKDSSEDYTYFYAHVYGHKDGKTYIDELEEYDWPSADYLDPNYKGVTISVYVHPEMKDMAGGVVMECLFY